MSGVVTIEPMRGRHVRAVRAIDELVYPNPWSVATWRTELAEPSRHHLVATASPGHDAAGDDGSAGATVVGHAGLLVVLDEVHVTTVAVHPEAQGRGIASRLLIDLLAEARIRGASAATLEVRATHRRTQRLYSRFGFRPVGVRPRYYSAPTDDAIVMWLERVGSHEVAERLAEIRSELDTAPSTVADPAVEDAS